MKTSNKSNSHYNKSIVMKLAWKLLRDSGNTLAWSECLKRAWNVVKNGVEKITIDYIYKTYYRDILNHITFKIGGRKEIAQELTNDVFLAANEHLLNYDVQKAKVKTWLFFIAKNKVIDFYRQNGQAKHSNNISISDFVDNETGNEYFTISDNNSASDYIENNEMFENIHNVMNQLKPKYKQIAELYFFENKKYDEIANILVIPMGTVKGMISRVRTMLQGELKETYILSKQV